MEAKNSKTIKITLILICLGVWTLVFQSFGLFPSKQIVYVKGGYINADVDNTVEVEGSVDIDNTVDVNIDEILGRPAGCRTSYTIDGREYQSLDVSIR